MLNVILEWLSQKRNYVSYKSEKDDLQSYIKKLDVMLIDSRVYHSDLQASECYILQKTSNIIDYFNESTTHYRHNFDNFNIKRNEYIYDKANMNEVTKNFTVEDTVQNRANIYILIKQLKHSLFSKNKFLEKQDKYSYKDIFFDLNEDSIIQTEKDIEDNLIKNDFDFKDFKTRYIDKIKDESRGLEEIGIFYPFVFDHDIFENKYFLFEINHLKFQKYDNNFIDIVNNFYKKYQLNCDKAKEIFTIEQYFLHPGFNYSKNFAYFNPFKNYEKYKTEYEQIRQNIKLKKLNFEDFIFELYEALNLAQFHIVKFQHENLINSLITSRSKDRQFSVKELIDIQIQKIENNKMMILSIEHEEHYNILRIFKNQPTGFRFTKNTEISDIKGFEYVSEYFKQKGTLILNDFLIILNKDDSSKLQYIFKHYKTKVSVITKKYKLNLANKKVVNEMLLDLVFFYNDKSKEKLSKPFNSRIKEIYKKNQNKDIEKIIDFNFQQKFIQQYSSYFNIYRPAEIKTEDGKTKYMMFNSLV